MREWRSVATGTLREFSAEPLLLRPIFRSRPAAVSGSFAFDVVVTARNR